MNFDSTPVLPRGFRCASRNVGLKPVAKDLALFVSDVDCAAAVLFTRNQFPGAPVLLGRETIKGGVLRAVIVNSKVSNVATGEAGLQFARRMAAGAAAEVGTDAGKVLVSSTGVIGVALPIEKIEAGMRGMAADLQADPMPGAHGIMTTDTHPKVLSVRVGQATITWIAKGACMIEPNMATMLAYIFTDATFDAPTLDGMLRRAADVSFNMLSIDTDTSTSDTCALLANGMAGPTDPASFEAALVAGCIRMAEIIARDGEGAKHLIKVRARGAKSVGEARTIAKSVVNSPLVKTMVAGADPNVGRLLMAIGKCFDVTIDRSKTDAWINGHQVVAGGVRGAFDDDVVRKALSDEVVTIEVALGVGTGDATAFGCDLTQGYIDENAAYYSS